MLRREVPMSKTTYSAIIALSALVAALGGTVYLTPDQLSHAYICTTNQNVGVFDYLSATSKTGYYNDTGEMKYKVCTNGFWKPLREYALDNNLDVNVLLQDMNEDPAPISGSYCCGQERPCAEGPCGGG